MKSLKIILSLVALFFASHAINAQQTIKGQAVGKPERVKEMKVEKKVEKQKRKEVKVHEKAEAKAKRPLKQGSHTYKVPKEKVNHKPLDQSKMKKGENTPQVSHKPDRKGAKAKTNKHKKYPQVKGKME